jgi:PAS domain S-box-containing protein
LVPERDPEQTRTVVHPLLSATEYRLLVEHSPVMIWRAGLDAKCDYFNDTWLAFTGRTLEQECGDGWAAGVHGDDLDRCVEYYLAHFQRREPFEMEYRLRRHDGVYRWIFDRGVPFMNDAGEFAGFIGSCFDVDDRRRSQAAREKQSEEQLAFAKEFEHWILAIVSHDIRNPLGAINGSAQLLALRAENDPKVRELAERINLSSKRIAHIVTDLLDVSRERQGGGIPIVATPTDMHDICREISEEITLGASNRTITVECDGDARGIWDTQRIAQAMSNLVGNAVQHSPPRSPVKVSIRADAATVAVEVHNEGVIPRELLSTIFAPFGAGATPRRRGQGLGLGLFIADSIVRAHQGSIEVCSTADAGTKFRVRLPKEATGTRSAAGSQGARK